MIGGLFLQSENHSTLSFTSLSLAFSAKTFVLKGCIMAVQSIHETILFIDFCFPFLIKIRRELEF